MYSRDSPRAATVPDPIHSATRIRQRSKTTGDDINSVHMDVTSFPPSSSSLYVASFFLRSMYTTCLCLADTSRGLGDVHKSEMPACWEVRNVAYGASPF